MIAAAEPHLLYPFVVMGNAMLLAIVFGGLCMRNWGTNRGRAKLFLALALLALAFVFAPVVHIMFVAPGPELGPLKRW